MFNKEAIKNKFKNLFKQLLRWIGFLLIGYSILLIAHQVIEYLKTGIWIKYSLTIAIHEISKEIPNSLADWYFVPTEWIGLNQILTTIFNLMPLSLTLFITGVFVFVTGTED